jgi:hypothetical protein
MSRPFPTAPRLPNRLLVPLMLNYRGLFKLHPSYQFHLPRWVKALLLPALSTLRTYPYWIFPLNPVLTVAFRPLFIPPDWFLQKSPPLLPLHHPHLPRRPLLPCPPLRLMPTPTLHHAALVEPVKLQNTLEIGLKPPPLIHPLKHPPLGKSCSSHLTKPNG